MKRLFLISPLPFYDEVVKSLQQRGLETCLGVISEDEGQLTAFRRLLPQAELISSFEILGAKIPGLDAARLPPPSLDLLHDLQPYEGVALQMLDRCNQDNLPLLELREFYLKYVSLWTELLDRQEPDAVVFHGTPHMGHDYVLYWLCRRRGVATIIVERTYLNERLYIRRDLHECPRASLDVVPEPEPDATAEEARHKGSYYNALNRELNDLQGLRKKLSWTQLLGRMIHGCLTSTWMWEPSFSSTHGLTQRRPTNLRIQWEEIRDFRNAKHAFDLYQQLATPVDFERPFVYYALHFEPERTTVPDGGRFTVQTDVIRRLADALPEGWRVLVKEHPRQFRRGNLWPKARSLDYYRRLAADPRVQLVPLETPSQELIARCRVAATITGTTGWEALQIGKPAIVFGYPWYRHAPGLFAVDEDGDVPRHLTTIARGETNVSIGAVKAYATALSAHGTFRGCFATRVLKMSQLTPEENGRNYAAAIDAALSEIAPVSTRRTASSAQQV